MTDQAATQIVEIVKNVISKKKRLISSKDPVEKSRKNEISFALLQFSLVHIKYF